MNNEKMGQFIAQRRKLSQMTQKDLAAKLHITDKAISKWERGLSCPDISLLSSLAEILGVTTNELLCGEKDEDAQDGKVPIDNALQYADKAVKCKAKSMHDIGALSFSLLLLVGVVVCAIIDMAVSQTLSWSLYPISCTVFAFMVFFPVIKFGGKGMVATLLAFSVFIIPFLYVLSLLIQNNALLLPIGIRMSVIATVFVWVVFALFKILKRRKLMASAILLVLVIPVSLLINISLRGFIDEPFLDVWDILNFSLMAVGAAVLFILDFRRKRLNAE